MDIDESTKTIITAAVQAAIAAHHEKEEQYRALIMKHEHLLYGNGRPGMVTLMDRLDRSITQAQSLKNKIIETLVLGAIAGIVLLLVQHGIAF